MNKIIIPISKEHYELIKISLLKMDVQKMTPIVKVMEKSKKITLDLDLSVDKQGMIEFIIGFGMMAAGTIAHKLNI